MAGLRGNIAWLAFAKQTVKGTPVTPYVHRVPFAGGNIGPSRQIDQLSETDANRDQGTSFVVQTGVEGAPEVYVRDANIHHILQFALGAMATSGTTNFTHTITPANTIPYVTFARGISDTLWEQFQDCMLSSLTVSADAGQPLTASFDIAGRRSVRETVEPAALPALANGAVYNYNEAAVNLAGGATSLIGSFEMALANNVTTQQTDDSVPFDVVPGLRELTVGFDLIFETLAEYEKFHYGAAGGTAQANTIHQTSMSFTFTKGANNEISFTFPQMAYEEFPVEPDPGGDPITVPVRARAQRGASPVVTAVVKNQQAT